MEITRPTFILNEKICQDNIRQMARKAKEHDLIFRPHFKTHQSAEIGDRFKEEVVTKITVSSVEMAEYFAESGWDDILIAFPVNILEIKKINRLSSKIKLSLLIESVESTKFLIKNLKHESGVYIKIDTGYKRTGIQSNNFKHVNSILETIKNSKILNFTGFLTHAGHTYNCKNKEEIIKIHYDSINQLKVLKDNFINDFPDAIISIGDTPTCSIADAFVGANEIRPGNFVFYDVMQYFLGSCKIKDIAVAMACPVVAKHAERNEIVIYGGAVHLSKDFLLDKNGNSFYGLVASLNEEDSFDHIPDSFVNSISQEHGILHVAPNQFKKFEIGDLIYILPVHSCLTANLANSYLTINDEIIRKFSN